MIFNYIFILVIVSKCNAVNIAYGKRTMQSSTWTTCVADLAVNGAIAEWSGPTFVCSHTFDPVEPWWAVDLGDVYTVSNVVIFGRTDCCSDRLSNFDIDVLMQPQCSCDKWTTFHRGQIKLCHYQLSSVTFLNATCPPDTVGRFVRIKPRGNGVVTLCEVEVYGEIYPNKTVIRENVQRACGYVGMVYNGTFLQTTIAKTNIECATQCKNHQQCCGAVFEKATNECTLDSKADDNEETTHSMYSDANKISFLVK